MTAFAGRQRTLSTDTLSWNNTIVLMLGTLVAPWEAFPDNTRSPEKAF